MKKFFLNIFLAFLLVNAAGVSHAAETPSEIQLKAAYLYNFAKFISWPESSFSDSKAPFVIGVLEDKSFADSLFSLTTKTVNQRPIIIKSYESIDKVSGVQMLYVGAPAADRQHSLDRILSLPIVTISDNENFASTHGIIQFVSIRGRLRFVINLTNARSAGVRIDSQLLSLAIDVFGVKK